MKLFRWPIGNLAATLFILSFGIVSPSHAANPWDAIIDPQRAVDWSKVGVQDGIPTNRIQCGATIAPYTGSASTINNAINACPEDHYVQLGPGTFNLSTGIEINRNKITLSGAGASATILKMSGAVNNTCSVGSGNPVMDMCTGRRNIGTVDLPSGFTGPENLAVVTGPYANDGTMAKGTTDIYLSNVTNLAIGSTLWFDQPDDTVDGYPNKGDIYICSGPAGTCAGVPDPGFGIRNGRSQVEGQIVTAIDNSTKKVTISPGLRMPNYRKRSPTDDNQNPSAWWGSPATILNNTGLENLTIDISPSGGKSGINIINCTNCWVKGVRIINAGTAGGYTMHLMTVNVMNSSFINNYFYGPVTTERVANYQINFQITSGSLIQNNIFHNPSGPIVLNGSSFGDVAGYNYVQGSLFGAGAALHGNSGMDLFEGNDYAGFTGDITHTTHHFITLFRNLHSGSAHNPTGVYSAGLDVMAKNRFFNIIGNVIGDPTRWPLYQSNMSTNPSLGGNNAIYEFGWGGNSGVPPDPDPNPLRTAFRWGNWDSKTANIRYCGNASNTNWDLCGNTSEVPYGISSYSNPIPVSESLPNSFYLPGPPSWWRAPSNTVLRVPKWPAIGPNVTAGNIPNTDSPTGGHADEIPARLCFENTPQDATNYSGTPIKLFDALKCYGSASPGSTPTAPKGFRIIQ